MDEAMRAPDGRRIAASAAAEADGNRYFCPSCKSEVYLRRPADRAFHFYHSPLREPDCQERVNAESPWASLEAEAKVLATRDRWARELINSMGGKGRFRTSYDRHRIRLLASVVLPHIYRWTRGEAETTPMEALNFLELLTRPDFSLLALLFLQEMIEALPDAGRFSPLTDMDVAQVCIGLASRIDWNELLSRSPMTKPLLTGLAGDLRPAHQPTFDGEARVQTTASGIFLVNGLRVDRCMFRNELSISNGDGKVYTLVSGRRGDATTLEESDINPDGDASTLSPSTGAIVAQASDVDRWSLLLCPVDSVVGERPIFEPWSLDRQPSDSAKAAAKRQRRMHSIADRCLGLRPTSHWTWYAPQQVSTQLVPALHATLDRLGLAE